MRADVAGIVRHEFRDVDKRNGRETEHSNERIIPERTHLNESMIFRDGVAVPMDSSQEVLDELDRRLESVAGTRTDAKTGKVKRVAVRKDAKVVRDLVIQLDPEFTRSSKFLLDSENAEHKAETKRLMMEVLDHYGDLYGRHNLLAASIHWDETSPHIHLLLTPIDDEGRIRQNSFITSGKGPKSGMAKNDRAVRERLKDAGYDVDPEPRGAGRSHLSVEEYANWQARQDELRAREIEVEDIARDFGRRERNLKNKQDVVEAQQDSLEEDAAALAVREQELAAREAAMHAATVKHLDEITAEAEAAAEAAQRRARDSDLGKWLEQQHPETLDEYKAALQPPRAPRVLKPLRLRAGERAHEAELKVLRAGWTKTRQPVVRVELDALDPAAAGKSGLVASARQIGQQGDRRWTDLQLMKPEDMAEVERLGSTGLVDDKGRPLYSVRGDLLKDSSELWVRPGSIKPSRLALPESWEDWDKAQQEAENRSGDHDGMPTSSRRSTGVSSPQNAAQRLKQQRQQDDPQIG